MTFQAFEIDADFLADIESGMAADEAARWRREPAARARPLDHAALWRHATRAPGDPVDFAVARLLKDDEKARAAMARMVAARAIACSPMAWAAADDSALSRQIGDFRLDLEPDGDSGVTALVLDVSAAGAVPRVLRADWNGESVVLALPEPQDGAIELFFFDADAASQQIVRVLREPTALIALE